VYIVLRHFLSPEMVDCSVAVRVHCNIHSVTWHCYSNTK